jgi:hypothetical protein
MMAGQSARRNRSPFVTVANSASGHRLNDFETSRLPLFTPTADIFLGTKPGSAPIHEVSTLLS